MQIAEHTKMRGFECPHLQLVNHAFYPKYKDLDLKELERLSSSRVLKVLKESSIEKCKH